MGQPRPEGDTTGTAAPSHGTGLHGEGPISDMALARLARSGHASARRAAEELRDRHQHAAVRYASLCAATPRAADELALEAAHTALRTVSATSDLAWRPHLLNAVLRTASSWIDSGRAGELGADLRAWRRADPPTAPGPLREAYGRLPSATQTVLWHDLVERDDEAETARLTGATAEAVRGWRDNAREALEAAYVRIYEDSAEGGCRAFKRLVVAFAKRMVVTSARQDAAFDDPGLDAHLAQCAHCGRAFDDLLRMRDRPDLLLAEGLLGWGGARYLAEQAADGRRRGDFTAAEPAPEGRRRRGPARATAREGGTRLPRLPEGPRGRRRLLMVGAFVGVAVAVPAALIALTLRPATHPPVAAAITPGLTGPDAAAAAPSAPSPSVKTSASASPSPSAGRSASAGPHPSAARSTPPSRPTVPGATVAWDFGEKTGDTTRDTSGSGNDGHLVGPPVRSSLHGGSLQFDGHHQYVQGTRAAVDTNSSFSVSAWVNLGTLDDFHVVAAQDGDDISGFFLQYDPRAGRWAMAMRDEDSTHSDKDQAVSVTRPAIGTWVHLTGVYDDPADQIRLYVNGVLEGTARHNGDWGAGGQFTVGRCLWNGDAADRFQGAIDDVRTFPRALTATEAATLAGRS
ncbi:LamG domain-containing protein [Streptomyces sp. NPDC086787]|uniref:LamG domain-containing protein n=1 Tax=Streptomyces sp. NPDC086787 TaxID=3365759 RepID=UPI00382B8050